MISRTIGLTIVAILSTIFLYFAWFYDWGIKENQKIIQGIDITAPWAEFIDECGSNVIITNQLRANEVFKNKYKNNIVHWTGYFIEKRELQNFAFGENSHSTNVLVKMEPSETEFEPDLAISFSESSYKEYKDIIDSLNSGDGINFSAIFISLGDEFNVNHLHAKSIGKNNNSKDIGKIEIIDSKLPDSIPEIMFAKGK